MSDRFFFAQDGDSHWYMVPAEKREAWNEWAESYFTDDDVDAYDYFENFRLGGGIEDYSFALPIRNI